ncbi:MAG: hypothetical protein FJY37_00235 [Betaproteobacteria bacterium]|nr:hypothetical protein [Betaproteobacteria bacterium]
MANKQRPELEAARVAVCGFGYLRLPFALKLCKKKYKTIGYDLLGHKGDAYRSHIVPTAEVATESLKATNRPEAATDPLRLSIADNQIFAMLAALTERVSESPSAPALWLNNAPGNKHG